MGGMHVYAQKNARLFITIIYNVEKTTQKSTI